MWFHFFCVLCFSWSSPSQGLCCSQSCEFKPAGQTCDEETDCQRESVCSGLSPLCPEPSPKENLTVCSQGTRVCLSGVRRTHPHPQCDSTWFPNTLTSRNGTKWAQNRRYYPLCNFYLNLRFTEMLLLNPHQLRRSLLSCRCCTCFIHVPSWWSTRLHPWPLKQFHHLHLDRLRNCLCMFFCMVYLLLLGHSASSWEPVLLLSPTVCHISTVQPTTPISAGGD